MWFIWNTIKISVSDGRTGIILSIPRSKEKIKKGSVGGTDQRDIIVLCTDPVGLGVFKGSWLEHARLHTSFSVGDFVQLNSAAYSAEAVGKCLGNLKDGRLGVVVSVGGIRDDYQRNIEVASIESSGQLSMEDISTLPPLTTPQVSNIS